MGDRLQKLKELEATLYSALASADIRSMAAIARQYRETIREIEEIEGGTGDDDELSGILAERRSDGKPSPVR